MFRTEEVLRGPQWTSPESHELFAPKLALAKAGWDELEPMSVSSGVRPSALLSLTAEELVSASKAIIREGLEIVVLGQMPIANSSVNSYSSNAPRVGTPGFRAALCRPGLSKAWLKAWEQEDDETIGELLGFPSCCRKFFQDQWKKNRQVDPTHVMDGGPDGAWEVNIMLRWLGVRLVPHLPCSWNCAESLKLAQSLFELGMKSGMQREMSALYEILSLPMSYSLKNGIGFVETEHFRFAFTSDMLVLGTEISRKASPKHWEDNGFHDPGEMLRAHSLIERVVAGLPKPHWIVDLGCGDGTLLVRLKGHCEEVFGCDSNELRVSHGLQRYPGLNITTCRIQDLNSVCVPPQESSLALLMPGRLPEMSPEDAAEVKVLLKSYSNVILYSYGDLPLSEWLEKTGLEIVPESLQVDEPFSAALMKENQDVLLGV